jgi:hypothetical protein
MDIISRKDAKAKGLTHYFTGKPCCRGHLELRLVNTNQCVACKRIWSQERAARSSMQHQLRLGFRLECAQCKKEIVLQGVARGHQGSCYCKIADSYKDRLYCGKSCEDKHYSNRADTVGRRKARYHSDPEYRRKHLDFQAVKRAAPGYKETQSSYHREWRKRNKEARAEYQKAWAAEKRATDLDHRLKGCLRHRVQQAIKHGYKSASTLQLLGCSIEQVRAHLEAQFLPGMSWDNWTSDGWHIDHIRPCATFDLSDPEQQRACFHYSNLQPLWASDNCAKRDSLDWQPAAA